MQPISESERYNFPDNRQNEKSSEGCESTAMNMSNENVVSETMEIIRQSFHENKVTWKLSYNDFVNYQKNVDQKINTDRCKIQWLTISLAKATDSIKELEENNKKYQHDTEVILFKHFHHSFKYFAKLAWIYLNLIFVEYASCTARSSGTL